MYSLRGPPFKAADREGRLVKDGSGETVWLGVHLMEQCACEWLSSSGAVAASALD